MQTNHIEPRDIRTRTVTISIHVTPEFPFDFGERRDENNYESVELLLSPDDAESLDREISRLIHRYRR